MRLLLIIAFTLSLAAQTTYSGIVIPNRAGGNGPIWILNDATLKARAQTWYNANAYTVPNNIVGTTTNWYLQNWIDIPFIHQMGGTSDCHGVAAAFGNLDPTPSHINPLTYGAFGNAINQVKSSAFEYALTLDWCYDVLSTTEKANIVAVLDDFANELITPGHSGWYTGADAMMSNLMITPSRALLMWAVITYNEPGHAATSQNWIDHALTLDTQNHFPFNLWITAGTSGIGSNGAWTEGSEYSRQMGSYLDLFCPAMMVNQGSDFCGQSPYPRDSVFHHIYSVTQNPVYYAGSANAYYELFTSNDDQGFDQQQTFNHIINAPSSAYGSFGGDWMAWAVSSLQAAHATTARYAQTLINLTTPQVDRPRTALSLPATPMADFSALALDLYQPDHQVYTIWGRSAWGGAGTQYTIKLGHYVVGQEGHSHFDAGSFQMTRGNRWMTRNSVAYYDVYLGFGGVIPTWAAATAYNTNARINIGSKVGIQVAANCTSGGTIPTLGARGANTADNTCSWHNADRDMPNGSPEGIIMQPEASGLANTIYVNGIGMSETSWGVANMLNLDYEPNWIHADADLTGLYLAQFSASRRNPWIQNTTQTNGGHVEREVLFIRPLETLITFDRISKFTFGSVTAAMATSTANIHCETTWILESSTVERCDNVDQTLRVKTLLPASMTQTVVDETNCGTCSAKGQSRLELTGTDGALTYQLNVMQSRAIGGTNHTISAVTDSNPGNPASGTLTFTITPSGGSATTVVFQKGSTGNSNVGSVNVAGGGAQSFSTTVMSETMSDSGPVWGASVAPTLGGTLNGVSFSGVVH